MDAPEIIRRTPEEMLKEFNRKFEYLMDSFMNKWGEYIEDSDQVEALVENSFDNWVSSSGWFEQ